MTRLSLFFVTILASPGILMVSSGPAANGKQAAFRMGLAVVGLAGLMVIGVLRLVASGKDSDAG